MNKLFNLLVVALAIALCSSQKCWKMVNQQCGSENRTVFTHYVEGPVETRQVQVDLGRKETREVCYHFGDVWCEEGVNIDDCNNRCCKTPVLDDSQYCKKCHCGYEERCITREFPVMDYEEYTGPSQVAVFETLEFPKNCQTQVEVDCGTEVGEEVCRDVEEKYVCGQSSVQVKVGVRIEEYQCGTKTVTQFKCYRQERYQCGQVQVQFFTGVTKTNPRVQTVSEQYDCGQTVTQEVCTYRDVYRCDPINADINWCTSQCNDISKLSWADQQTCLNQCFCGIKKTKETCSNQTFNKMCYREVEKTVYDEEPTYELRTLPKECERQVEITEDIEVPKYCEREVDIFETQLVDIYCCRIVQVCEPGSPVTPPVNPPKSSYSPNIPWEGNAVYQAWCDANCQAEDLSVCLTICHKNP